MSKKQLIPITLILLSLICLPLVSATTVLMDSQDFSLLDGQVNIYASTGTAAYYADYQVFVGDGNKLTQINVQACKYGDTGTTAYLACQVFAVTGSEHAETPTGSAIAVATNTPSITALSVNPTFSPVFFYFNGSATLTNGTKYAFVILLHDDTNWDGTKYVRLGTDQDGASDGNSENSGEWTGAAWNSFGYPAKSHVYYVFGDDTPVATPTPTPTASPSPTPIGLDGGLWNYLAPYGTLLLPLIIILLVAIVCGRFGGIWGFFAGLNVSIIAVYAIMGATYFPLWGIVVLVVVDALLLFGKMVGRV